MITAIIVLNRFDCDAEMMNEKFVEKVKDYLGSRNIEESDSKCPIITTKNLVLSKDEKEKIVDFAVEEKQFILFLENVDTNDVGKYLTLESNQKIREK